MAKSVIQKFSKLRPVLGCNLFWQNVFDSFFKRNIFRELFNANTQNYDLFRFAQNGLYVASQFFEPCPAGCWKPLVLA
jgi:hypothetical protein